MKEIKDHIKQGHENEVGEEMFSAMFEPISQPIRQIAASACPLCDYERELNKTVRISRFAHPGFVNLEQFKDHLGRHLEQLALLALPRNYLVQASNNEDKSDYEPLMSLRSRSYSPQSIYPTPISLNEDRPRKKKKA